MFNFQFDQQTLNVLNMALGELPYKIARPVIDNFNNQIAQQQRDEAARVAQARQHEIEMQAAACRAREEADRNFHNDLVTPT